MAIEISTDEKLKRRKSFTDQLKPLELLAQKTTERLHTFFPDARVCQVLHSWSSICGGSDYSWTENVHDKLAGYAIVNGDESPVRRYKDSGECFETRPNRWTKKKGWFFERDDKPIYPDILIEFRTSPTTIYIKKDDKRLLEACQETADSYDIPRSNVILDF